MSNLCAKCLTRIDEGRMYCKDCDDSAKEMFKKLGYSLCTDTECDWEICFKNNDGHFICFENKMIEAYVYFWNSWLERYEFDSKEITIQELQAINKMVEELGWNNE